jgi:hypothetical protein
VDWLEVHDREAPWVFLERAGERRGELDPHDAAEGERGSHEEDADLARAEVDEGRLLVRQSEPAQDVGEVDR